MIIPLFALALLSPPQAAPPAMTQPALDVWIERTLKLDGWVILAADQAAVALGQASGVTRDGDEVAATVRHEYYAPIEIGGHRTRSNLQRRQFDCDGLRSRTVEMTLYRDNNLIAPLDARAFPDARWTATTPNTVSRTVLERACAGAGWTAGR